MQDIIKKTWTISVFFFSFIIWEVRGPYNIYMIEITIIIILIHLTVHYSENCFAIK